MVLAADSARLLELYGELASVYPRSPLPKRLPLDHLEGMGARATGHVGVWAFRKKSGC